MVDRPFRVGALVIGSLLWDTAQEKRRRWHDRWLDLEGRYRVRAPIRYGRRAKAHRHDTHTMVLSEALSRDPSRAGTAWMVPHRAPFSSVDGLVQAVNAMGEAEGFRDGLHDDWGWVGLSVRPDSGLEPTLREQWRVHAERNPHRDDVPAWYAPSERPTIDADGFLTIPWPEPIESRVPGDEPDVLLATITRPDMPSGRYATAAEIASRMLEAGYTGYFDANRAIGISTFQDEEIRELLAQGETENSP